MLWHTTVNAFLGDPPQGEEGDEDYRPWPKLTGVEVVTTDPLTGEAGAPAVLEPDAAPRAGRGPTARLPHAMASGGPPAAAFAATAAAGETAQWTCEQ